MPFYPKAFKHRKVRDTAPLRKQQSVQFKDNRTSNKTQSSLQARVNSSERVVAQRAKADAIAQSAPVQKKENRTGLPDQLKSGIEQLSGLDMSDTRVHYNSSKPAQLQAHAYAQGTDIHVASGQEKHLAHEAWHVVQQKQGRVKPTTQLKGKTLINDDTGLEREADIMGAKAMGITTQETTLQKKAIGTSAYAIQRLKKDSGDIIDQGKFEVEMTPGVSQKLQTPTEDTIVTYTPDANAQDANPIVLDQIVRSEVRGDGLSTWAGDAEERRDKTMVDGWFMDHIAAGNKPRKSKDDAEVPTNYQEASKVNEGTERDPNWVPYTQYDGTDTNQHGKKLGDTITPSILTDHPASNKPYYFQAEVIAKGKQGGQFVVYGSAKWSFKTKEKGGAGVDKHKLVKDGASVITFHANPSANYTKAKDKYNEVYRNKGAETSPERVDELIEEAAKADASKLEIAEAKVKLGLIMKTIRANTVLSDGRIPAAAAIEVTAKQAKDVDFYDFDEEEVSAYKAKHGVSPYDVLGIDPAGPASEHSSEA